MKTKSGKVLQIFQDPYRDDPREMSDHLGTMVIFHKRYSFGDKTDIRSADFNGWNEMEEHIEKEYNTVLCLRIYMLDHSGITISTKPFGDPWDSGQVGFIYVEQSKLTREYGEITDQILRQAQEVLEAEVREVDYYLRGEVYGFKLIRKSPLDDPNLDMEDEEGWGFLGSNFETNGLLENLSQEDQPESIIDL